jgi:hypothetical protein
MESRLVKLKRDFNNLINIRNNVKNIFDILQSRIDKLKMLYSEFIHNNKNQMFVFGLDSFHFQSKLIDIEYDDMKRLFLVINNRMYCEYFKLNKIIIDYILNNITDKKITEAIKVDNFQIYKDLEPFKEYKFETLMDIHENILNLINILISELNIKENDLTIYKTKQCIGLNIDNFVTTFNFNNNVKKERISLFTTYIEFFHKLHTKYLKRFSNKIQLVYKDINSDIQFDESIKLKKNINSVSSESIDLSTDSDNETNEIMTSKINSEHSLTISSKSNLSESSKSNLSESSKSNLSESSKSNTNTQNILLTINNKKNDIISNDELNEMFLNIESSCDSIINKINENMNEVNNMPLSKEVNDSNENNMNFKSESKEEIIHKESSINEVIESVNITDIEKEVEIKKKRLYKPRKKKV